MEGRDATKRNQVNIRKHNTFGKGLLRGQTQQSKVVLCIQIVQSFGIKQSNPQGINKSKMI